VCGDTPTIVARSTYEEFCGVRGVEGEVDASGVPTLSVEELSARRRAVRMFQLLDVREPHEYDIVRIPGAQLFPLSELALTPPRARLGADLHALVPSRRPERRAYHLLRQAGFGRPRCWTAAVDGLGREDRRVAPSLLNPLGTPASYGHAPARVDDARPAVASPAAPTMGPRTPIVRYQYSVPAAGISVSTGPLGA